MLAGGKSESYERVATNASYDSVAGPRKGAGNQRSSTGRRNSKSSESSSLACRDGWPAMSRVSGAQAPAAWTDPLRIAQRLLRQHCETAARPQVVAGVR